MSGLVILFMLFDSILKLIKPAPVVEGTDTLGYAEHYIIVIGILGLLSTILYAIHHTSFVGALLLTGYFGGVVATQIGVDATLFTTILFPVYLAVLAWGGACSRPAYCGRRCSTFTWSLPRMTAAAASWLH